MVSAAQDTSPAGLTTTVVGFATTKLLFWFHKEVVSEIELAQQQNVHYR